MKDIVSMQIQLIAIIADNRDIRLGIVVSLEEVDMVELEEEVSFRAMVNINRAIWDKGIKVRINSKNISSLKGSNCISISVSTNSTNNVSSRHNHSNHEFMHQCHNHNWRHALYEL